MKQFFVLAGIAIMLLSQLGCSSDEEQTQVENPAAIDETSTFSGAPLLGDVVLENMYEDEARQLTDKTPVQIVTVLEGTNRVTLDARFRGVRDFGFGFPLYEFELMDEAAEAMGGIAKGMSGSPVGPPGRIMGALAYGDSFARAPSRFWATSIDAMEGAITHQTFGEMFEAERAAAAPGGIQAAYAPVKTPLMLSGVQPHRLQQLSSHLEGTRFDFVQLFADIDDAPGAPPTTTTRLAAGDMIGVAIATGDVVNSIGFGTVTQVYDDGTFVAFGHPMFGTGKSALPVYRAVTNGIVPVLEASYKSSSAYGNPIGTITKDLTPAIVGVLGEVPSMIPVKVTYQAGNGPVIEKNHKLAYGQELFVPMIAAATMDSIRQERSPGTVEGTVTLRFKETEAVYTESFRSAAEDPFSEVLLNIDRIVFFFTDAFANSAGQATLTEVSISLSDKPQIMLAELHEVIVPEEGITPGEDLAVSVVLLPHWSAADDERMIQRDVTIEVPESFPVGPAMLTVATNSSGLFDPFGGAEGAPRPLPENLDELIKKMEADQIDPSLVTITLEALGPDPGTLLPEGLDLPPEGFPLPEEGEIPADDAAPEEGEMPDDGEGPPEDVQLPEGFPPLDELPFPPDFGPPPTVELTINIDGFIVFGFKDASVTIEGEGMVDDLIPAEIVEPVEPPELPENEAPAAEE